MRTKNTLRFLAAAAGLAAAAAPGAPLLEVAPTFFAKQITQGQTLLPDAVQVGNPGDGTLTYSVIAGSIPVGWLSASPSDGSAAAGVTNTVVLSYDTAPLDPGIYAGQVDVSALGVGGRTVNIDLRINRRPGLAWDAAGKAWTNHIMAGDTLPATTLSIWNPSGEPAGAMRYQTAVLNDPYGWVSVSPAGGISTGDVQSASVTYSTAGLAAGVYTAQIRLSGTDDATGAPATNGDLTVNLELTVHGSPVLKTQAQSWRQTTLENHARQSSFLIWNDGQAPRGAMRFSVTPVGGAASWLRVIPPGNTGLVAVSTATVFLAWGDAGTAIPAGSYSGSLRIEAWDQSSGAPALGSPLTVPVALTVAPRTPVPLEPPEISGIMHIGQTVTAEPGLWQNQDRLVFRYQWERASSAEGAGREIIAGVSGPHYVIQPADRGKFLRVVAVGTDPTPFPLTGSAGGAWVNRAKVKALRADFNGDGITDLWFYDPSHGFWKASFGSRDSAQAVFLGRPGLVAVPGDYDGNGYEDLALYEPANGLWHVLLLPGGTYLTGSLLGGSDEEAQSVPVPADYDGDGTTDPALFWRGYWAILYSESGSVSIHPPLAAGGQPVVGDWDGDGRIDRGVYAGGVWTLHSSFSGEVTPQSFGGSGPDILPSPADFDGDGMADLAVYDRGRNEWRWRESRTGIVRSRQFGQGGLVALPGYYDRDASADWAQARLSDNGDFILWEVKRSSDTNFPFLGQSYQQSTGHWRVSW